MSTTREKILAILIFPLSYIYITSLLELDIVARIFVGIFVLGFIAFGEAFYWSKKRSIESIIFLALTVIIAIAYCFDIGTVWDSDSKIMFLHLYAVYWVLCRADCLALGKTSHLFIWDGITGFFKMPFSNFPLAIETIADIFSKFKKKSKSRIIICIVAIIAGMILFCIAMGFLQDSDDNFEALIHIVDISFEWKYIFRIPFAVIVGLYLYGFFGGCFRTKRETITDDGKKLWAFIKGLAKVPTAIWIGFIALFSIFYIVFFVLQGSYLFGAFSMILPKEYTFSEYARRGFGDMCAVMIINFLLMWLAYRTSEVKTALLKAFGTLLMGESLIFAIIAFMKLFMYINAYGFTPLRLQSVWLVVILVFACICILISLYTKKKTARIWFVASAISLGLLVIF